MRLIDADALHAALKAKQKWVVKCGDKHNEGYTYDQVHFAIDDAPTIEERKTGEWEWISKVAHNIGHRCSICKKPAERIISKTELVENYYCNKAEPMTVYTHVWLLSDYCPHCGADMRGGKRLK